MPITGITAEIALKTVDFQKPATPQRGVGVGGGLAAEVLGRQAEDFVSAGQWRGLPPVQFHQVVDAELLEPASQPHGNAEAQVIPETSVQLVCGCFVEMVVVIVGYQYQVDGRHVTYRQGRGGEPLGPDKPEGAGTVGQHRVGQHVQAPVLEQEGCMPQPGQLRRCRRVHQQVGIRAPQCITFTLRETAAGSELPAYEVA